jgi:hypothetical protein
MDKFWNEMIFKACGGNASDMAFIRRFDIFDFFDFIVSKNG